MKMQHPAKYSNNLLPIFDKYLPKSGKKILDPFAGTGKLREIRPNCILLEIEPEWGNMSNAIIGDATNMPFEDSEFDAICTSPTYGNRMADNFIDRQPRKNYKRHTYRHYLGRPLSTNNSGAMQWGNEYRNLHEQAWKESYRVLKQGGMFVLNISDHIRKGKVVKVSQWHETFLKSLGFIVIEKILVKTKRQRQGQNGNIRVGYENVLVFVKR